VDSLVAERDVVFAGLMGVRCDSNYMWVELDGLDGNVGVVV
jgi:hypothetical protein